MRYVTENQPRVVTYKTWVPEHNEQVRRYFRLIFIIVTVTNAALVWLHDMTVPLKIVTQ